MWWFVGVKLSVVALSFAGRTGLRTHKWHLCLVIRCGGASWRDVGKVPKDDGCAGRGYPYVITCDYVHSSERGGIGWANSGSV